MKPGWLVGILLLLAALLAAGHDARANPFAPGSKPPPEAPAAGSMSVGAPSTGFGAWMAELQRRVNKQLVQRMADVTTGSPVAVMIGAALSFLYGVFHAAGPGHGKVVTMSYFLGRDARPWRGVLMGGQIALVHVGGAILLAIAATLWMSGAAAPSVEDMRWVKLVSYAAVTAIGLWLFVQAVRGNAHCHHDHGHGHDHGQHDHVHGHDHGAQRSGLAAALVAGAVPCTGAVLVLVYCVGQGVPLLGLAFVLMIGLGMAATLTGFGLIGMVARRRTLALAARGGGGAEDRRALRWRRGLDLLGPSLIVGVGLLLFVEAY
ncbi:MAG: hypothetical protein L6R19_28470 [Alphaproteobacteria bacterium]|nr:hypothetical protein [Alphaproteobacteria bacterium]